MKFRILLGLAVVLGLLLAVSLPIAAKQGGDKGNGKDPPAHGQDKVKKDKVKQDPAGTPDPAEALVTICHQPGKPGQKTMEVRESTLDAHLHHGDVLDACLEITPSPTPTDTLPITNTATITLCHKPGTPAEKTLVLPAPAGPGHLRHGDYEGECVEVTPSPTPTETVTITDTTMVTICHKPGTPAEQTLLVAEPAVPAHLRHGDEMGACPEEPPPEAEAVAADPVGWRNKR